MQQQLSIMEEAGFASEVQWLALIQDHLHLFRPDDIALQPESRPSFPFFRLMCKLGFVTIDSQEGRVVRDAVPVPMSVYGQVYRQCKETWPANISRRSPKFQKLVTRRFEAIGGSWEKGIARTERAYVRFVTTAWLAETLDYCINRYTHFVSLVQSPTSNKIRLNGPRIGTTFSIHRREIECEKLEDLEETGAIHVHSSSLLETCFLRSCDMKQQESLHSDLVSVAVFDPVHGRLGLATDGLFQALLVWMKKVLEQVPVPSSLKNLSTMEDRCQRGEN